MPKGKLDVSRGNRRNVTRKHKIGGRKSLRSALHMSNADLQIHANKSGKDGQTARNELARRSAR